MDIEQKIAKTKIELLDNAIAGHILLSEQEIDSSELPAARMMFIIASLGDDEHEALIPSAVGLELLRLGIKKHYMQTVESARNRNLNIISADYYYAQAIDLVTPFGRGDIVACLAKAIADTAEAAAIDRAPDNNIELSQIFTEKSAGVYKAAVRLGLLLGNRIENRMRDILIDHAIFYAMILRFKNGDPGFNAGGEQIDSLRRGILERLKLLPPLQREALASLVV
jgi:hypothetical protein